MENNFTITSDSEKWGWCVLLLDVRGQGMVGFLFSNKLWVLAILLIKEIKNK